MVQILGTPARKITPRGSYVRVKQTVAAEDVVTDLIPQVIGRVAGKMDGFRFEVADSKDLVVVK